MSATVTSGDVAVYHRPSGRGQRTDTAPYCVTVREGDLVSTDRYDDRESAMDRAAARAGVKL